MSGEDDPFYRRLPTLDELKVHVGQLTLEAASKPEPGENLPTDTDADEGGAENPPPSLELV